MALSRCLQARIACPSIVVFAVAIAILSTALHNGRFWHDAIVAVRPASPAEVLFLASIFAVMVLVHATLLLLIPRRRPVQVAAAAIVVLAAVVAYFTDSLGIIVNPTIVRSVFETDTQEVSALFTWRFASYLLFAGIVPSLAILRVRLPRVETSYEVRQRLTFIGVALGMSAMLVGGMFSFYAPFWRYHKEITSRMNPDTAVVAAVNYVREHVKWASASGPLANPAGPTQALPGGQGQRPVLMFVNVGETARGANFQLGGYGRETNPELSKLEGVLYFNNASSCGTATAVSVPCMFWHGGRSDFSIATAGGQANLLDAVSGGGYRVEWRENNTGGKGVPARMKTIVYDPGSDAKLCAEGTCYDEIMLSGLAGELRAKPQNTMIVFHQMGSHGPSYWQRYPARFEKFKPACQTNELWRCPREELLNVYDNTIVYTDFVLAEQIRLLQSLSDRFDSVMIYVSDHGESLGEKGFYLHGAPYMIAPREQTHIPFLIWTSKGYRDRLALTEGCIRAQRDLAVSHDNLYHTVLGALGLSNRAYRSELDLLRPCATWWR